jgi:anti-sigma B factor antagonist
VPFTDSEIKDGLLTVHQVLEGEQIRVALEGELDLATAPTLETVLEETLASGKEVLIDLGELEFLDSTGVTLLVMALRQKSAARLSFLPSRYPEVGRLLELTGLDQRMRFVTAGEGEATASAV